MDAKELKHGPRRPILGAIALTAGAAVALALLLVEYSEGDIGTDNRKYLCLLLGSPIYCGLFGLGDGAFEGRPIRGALFGVLFAAIADALIVLAVALVTPR